MKWNLNNYWYALIGCIGLIPTIKAQVPQPDADQHHIIQAGAGFDHSLVAINLGYGYYMQQFRTAVYTDFTQSTALLATGNYRTRLGFMHWLPLNKHWTVKGKLGFVYAQSYNKAGKYKGLGYQLEVTPMFLTQKGSFGIDVSLNPFFLTHIKHSEYWKEFLYEDAKDGWYKNTVKTFRIGGSVSRYINEVQSLEVNLKGGYQTNGNYDKLVPGLYLNIHLNYRL